MDIKNKCNKTTALAFASMIMLGSLQAKEMGILGRLTDFNATFQGLTILIALAGALIGIGIMIAGGFQLKKYADDSRSVSPVKGLIYLVSGVLMFAISATSDIMKESIFGKEADTSGGDFDFKEVQGARKG